ncbi:MAG: hypothetical protein QM484_06725 [Woeseiaceae bacterium]
MVKSLSKIKGRKERGSFSRMPHQITNSENYRTLSVRAKALLYDTNARYNGKNNGDFDYTLKNMKKWGWSSNDTIARAKKELLEKGWIVLTRQGGRNKCNLYALTIWAIDNCKGKLDVSATNTAPASWKVYKPKN